MILGKTLEGISRAGERKWDVWHGTWRDFSLESSHRCPKLFWSDLPQTVLPIADLQIICAFIDTIQSTD